MCIRIFIVIRGSLEGASSKHPVVQNGGLLAYLNKMEQNFVSV